MASYLFRKYSDFTYTRWERSLLWDMIEPYRRPNSFTPLITLYMAAFYTGLVGSAITEQLYKEKHWEDHPGEAVPLVRPKFYGGPWRVLRGETLPPKQMTTYGTIPTEPLPGTQSLFLRVRERFISDVGAPRPWMEMFQIESLNLPPSLPASFERIGTNITFFRNNYIIIILFSLLISLLWNPFLLVVFFVMVAAWTFYYYLRNEPILLLGVVISENVVMAVLLLTTLAALYLTDVKDSIIFGLFLGGAVDLAHAASRRTDDLALS